MREVLAGRALVAVAAGCLCLSSGGIAARAADVVAASCSYAHVQAALAEADEGDVVRVPAGHCTWNQPLRITKAITLQGAGIDATVLHDEAPDASLIQLETELGGTYRVTGLSLVGGTVEKGIRAGIVIAGSSRAWRVDHVKFDRLRSRGIIIYGHTFGVVDHSEFILQGTQAILIQHDSWDGYAFGDGSWAAPSNLGTGEFVFIEDNLFRIASGSNGTAVDCIQGGRFVFRYNIGENVNVGSHGTESSGRQRSCRAYEIYSNEMTHPNGTSRAISLRGGTGVIFDNTLTGFDHLAALQNYRSFESYQHWGSCNGLSPYDGTDALIHASGTHTGGDGSALLLSSSGQSWTAGQWVGYAIINVTRGTTGAIIGNSETTVSVAPGANKPNIVFDSGDSFEVRMGYPCLDQVGRGQGQLLNSGTTPPSPMAWPNQILDPLYEWSNTLDGVEADIGRDVNPIVEGRDFFDDTQKPDYVPFQYPHPLTVAGGAVVGDSSPPLVVITSP